STSHLLAPFHFMFSSISGSVLPATVVTTQALKAGPANAKRLLELDCYKEVSPVANIVAMPAVARQDDSNSLTVEGPGKQESEAILALRLSPFHQQDTPILCGEACVQIVVNHLWGNLLDQRFLQREIINNQVADKSHLMLWGAEPTAIARTINRQKPAGETLT